MFYTLHAVEPLRYDSVLIEETNEWMICYCSVTVHILDLDSLDFQVSLGLGLVLFGLGLGLEDTGFVNVTG